MTKKIMKHSKMREPRGVNLDITHRCGLECPRCVRQTYWKKNNLKIPGWDMPIEDFDKITDFVSEVNFCGQLSDPVHHPKFLDFLKLCYEKNVTPTVHHASNLKNMDWYLKAFKTNPDARWWFAIDGLPEESHKYRVNQDGVKMYNILKESTKHLNATPLWQYIVFSYNEQHVDQARQMAAEIGVKFSLVTSSRWIDQNDPLMPTLPEYRMSPK
jgi:MoaA/NifB/PqqE/SkfB family radical SAM enzyme